MKGIRTSCITGKEEEVELDYVIEDGGVSKVFRILNGPTGYESFCVEDGKKFGITERGWNACVGTKGVWDSLFISPEEMRKVFRDEDIE